MTYNFTRPLIMGILNITKDSFSDGSKYLNTDDAVQWALKMIEEGADIIDIGGESTRPGAEVINEEVEIERVMGVFKKLKIRCQESQIPLPLISIDTYKSKVARTALEAGADIINDVYALRYDDTMASVLQDFPESKIVLMHMQGTPATMQMNPFYEDVVSEITDFFEERINYCLNRGISKDRIILDPGIGFGKTFEHNITILKNMEKFHVFGLPVLLGASRKRFIGQMYSIGNAFLRSVDSQNQLYASEDTERINALPTDRLIGSLASTMLAYLKKIDIIRVHDVKEHRELLDSLSWMF